ncbi:tRNA (adenosine(37)-N6)-threonylcarbamoyltransferase complex dimerization subunit type 1 TsaB [Clostridium sp. 19966]|uniref:tRNA (adenosine(37)-N6)-threonylcarbamoyltransferase complex dimerization subunit type 1 TsaB n=1 Tax=Clostridium sp. 19966 TaxID=2768166 RepID=UPI0028DEFF01|nr:tRNA (adenosine(37)-N6)-threonylcarbamoyltransferase complex dimerization subunit type 1 TsaB [Clostridium sp. 19966]MDT8715563.1 tRNA (adenosine(37)-N6)-threonylcarbamoyltransferase complex dimerization subunit type 1 TsaB [Clostridium sp. 19966]
MRVLSIDTATESASCAVLEDDKLLGEINFNFGKAHSVILMSMIDTLLTSIHVDISEIDGFISSRGPGSFTGLRIGMATVKGLCFGSKKDFISVSTLDSLAFNLAYSSGVVCPIMDALRGNVYTALYTFKGEELQRISEYMAIPIEELIKVLKEYEKVNFIGDGIIKFKEVLKNNISNTNFAPVHLNAARASSLGELGMKLLKSGMKEDINTSTPIYLRKSQAEREYDKKMGLSKNE